MIQYILECIAFQLLFLVIYDFFLKRETFFQWNRAYLLGTFLLSIILPWVKIEAFKQQVPQTFSGYPDFLWNLNAAQVAVTVEDTSGWQLTWQEGVFYSGMVLAFLFFLLKLRQVYLLKKRGKQVQFPNFTQVIITNSSIAFSFFKSIFIGDKVLKMKHDTIIEHELVHIKQGHTWDLLFFELMRIIAWFNPLVYVYQNRVSELHEFIADAHVAKEDKSEQYQQLLSQVFQTEHISFINQFFTKSLIKKRIVMLQKSKSKRVWQLKYLLLVPLVMGMLFYTSCELDKTETNNVSTQNLSSDDQMLIEELETEILEVERLHGDEWFTSILKKYNDSNSSSHVQTKKEYFATTLSMIFYLKDEMEKFPNKLEVDASTITYPSTAGYEDYLPGARALAVLDNNLKYSVSKKEMSIRLIVKEDKNLGPGDWIKVADIKNLSGDETRKVNAALDNIKGTPRNVVIKDDDYSFLIRNEFRKVPKTLYNELVRERNRLLQSANENNPIIVNLDNQLKKLKARIDYGDKKNATTVKFEVKKYSDDTEVPFAVVDEAPIFPGCEDALDKRACFNKKLQLHIGKNFSYPIAAQEAGIQGRVSTMFTITSGGTIENIRMRGPDKSLEDEVERIIKRLPKMTPGKHKGKSVNVPFSIPVNFKLQ